MTESGEKKNVSGGCCPGGEFSFSMGDRQKMTEMMQACCGEGGSFDCTAMLEMFRGEDGSFDCGKLMDAMRAMMPKEK